MALGARRLLSRWLTVVVEVSVLSLIVRVSCYLPFGQAERTRVMW